MKPIKIRSCAGCRALFKMTNNGYPYVYCYLNKQMVNTDYAILDKRLDISVYKKPVENCKIKTNIQLANSWIGRKEK